MLSYNCQAELDDLKNLEDLKMSNSIILTDGNIEYEFTYNIWNCPMVIGTRKMELGEVYYDAYTSNKTEEERKHIVTEQDVAIGKVVCFYSELVTKEEGNSFYKELLAKGWNRK